MIITIVIVIILITIVIIVPILLLLGDHIRNDNKPDPTRPIRRHVCC